MTEGELIARLEALVDAATEAGASAVDGSARFQHQDDVTERNRIFDALVADLLIAIARPTAG